MNYSRRIDQPIDNYPSYRLYQPLRRSLLRNSLSQSNISSRGELSMSRLNHQQDLSTSRISKRMRSLSPQQVETIKTNIFIPVNKRLLPTKNLQLVKNKKYNAIDVQQKVYKPIPAIRFNSLNRFNVNKVQQIVYQVQEKPHYIHHNQTQTKPHYVHQNKTQQQYHYVHHNQNNTMQQQSGYFNPFRRQQAIKTQNIYTLRNQTQYDRGYQRPRENSQSKRLNANVRARSPQVYMNASFGMPTSQTSFAHNINHNIPSTIPMNTSHVVNNQYKGNNNNYLNNNNLYTNNNNNNNTTNKNLYTTNNTQLNSSQSCNPIRQVPTSDYLPGSRTSFQVQKMSSQVSKGYDFSRLTSSTVNKNGSQDGVSEYSSRKKQEWKYNLYSIFDQPINTKCNKTGCFNNQIIASRPNIYQWQQ